MVIFEIFKSPCMDLPFRTLIAPGIGSMDPVSFWPFLLVTGCCEQFYSHLVVLYIEAGWRVDTSVSLYSDAILLFWLYVQYCGMCNTHVSVVSSIRNTTSVAVLHIHMNVQYWSLDMQYM